MSDRIRVAAGSRINGVVKGDATEQLRTAAQSAPQQRKGK